MKQRGCLIFFDEADLMCGGRVLEVEGERLDDFTFLIFQNEDMYWTIPFSRIPGHYAGIVVEELEKEKLLSYLLQKGQEVGYTFILH